MASDNETKTFSLDLDSKEFIAKALEAKLKVGEIGNSENLVGLTQGLLQASAYLGVIGVAALALKSTFDAVFDAENIEAVNQQFEILTQNAGISGEALKKGLTDAAGGLVTDNELLQAANKAVVALGSSSAKLPEIMNLARQATAVMGGDLISNFEKLNMAIEHGSTRMLQSMGITIDHTKALRDFANQHGITVNALSETEKKQAILNAVLEKGSAAFKGMNPNIREAQTSWQLFSTSMKEIGEIFTIAWAKVVGPTIKNDLAWLADWAKSSKTWFQASFGQGAEAAAAKSELLGQKITEAKVKIIDFEQAWLKLGDKANQGFNNPGNVAAMERWKSELKAMEVQYAELQKKKESAEGTRAPSGEGSEDGKASGADLEKRKASELKFRQELLAIKQQRANDDMELADSVEKVDAIHKQEQLNLEEQHSLKIAQIHNQRATNEIATDKQMHELIEQEDAEHKNRLAMNEDKLANERIKSYERAAKEAKTLDKGISAGAMAESAKASRALHNFGDTGAMAFKALNKNASNAFIAIGEGSMDAGEAMKGFMLNSLADIAQAQGELLLASSLINPLNAAAGAGLLILSGVLRAAAGSSKGSSGGVSSGGGGGGGGDSMGGSGDSGSQVAQNAQEKKSVNVTIAGSYFETEQTKTRLVEMIRESSDAQDFNVSTIKGQV